MEASTRGSWRSLFATRAVLGLALTASLVAPAGCSRCADGGHKPAGSEATMHSPAAAAATTTTTAGQSVGGLVLGADGQPVVGARIELRGVGALAAVAHTDARGGYRFTGLPAGHHVLTASHAGSAVIRRSILVQPARSQQLSVSLSPEVPLVGQVVSADDGRPIPGVMVTARAVDSGPGAGGDPDSPESRATTKADGRFALGGLAAGRHLVETRCSAHLDVRQLVDSPRRLLVLRLARLYARPGKVLRPARSAGGQASRVDLGQVVVRLFGGHGSMLTVEVGSDGQFELRAPAGIYELVALSGSAPWSASNVLSGVELGAAPARSRRTSGATSLPAASEAEPLTLRLQPAHELAGRVVGPGDRPVARSRISVLPEQPSAFRLTVQTGEDGRFVIGPLLAGEHRLEAWAAGLLPEIGRTISLPASGPVIVALTAGLTLQGQVVDAAGDPVTGAVVRAVIRGPAGGPRFQGTGELGVVPGPVAPIPRPGELVASAAGPTAIWATVSDYGGHFRLSGLPEGAVQVVADHDRFAGAESPWFDLGAGPVAAGSLRLVLRPAYAVEGQVRTVGGAPVAGARIAASIAQEIRHAVSDGLGRYRIGGLPGPGQLELTARRAGFLPAAATVELRQALQPAPDLVLDSATGEVRGMVLDEHGMPLERARVVAVAAGGDDRATWRVETRSDSAGRFALRGVGASAITLHTEHPGHVPAEQLLPADAGRYLFLRLQRQVRLVGRVQDGRLAGPIQRFTLRVDGGSAREVHHAQGAFELGVAAGRRVLRVDAAGHATSEVAVEVGASSAAMPTPVVVELLRAGTVTGEVYEASGEPLEGVAVSIAVAGMVVVSDRTDARGSFALRRVAEGTHALVGIASDGRELSPMTVAVRAGETTGPLRLFMRY